MVVTGLIMLAITNNINVSDNQGSNHFKLVQRSKFIEHEYYLMNLKDVIFLLLGCTDDDDCPHGDEICDKASQKCVTEPKCDFNNFPYESHDENSRILQDQGSNLSLLFTPEKSLFFQK